MGFCEPLDIVLIIKELEMPRTTMLGSDFPHTLGKKIKMKLLYDFHRSILQLEVLKTTRMVNSEERHLL